MITLKVEKGFRPNFQGW